MSPELVTSIASLVVAIGGVTTILVRYKGDRAKAVEDAVQTASTAFQALFQDERTKRDAERAEHIAELHRLHGEHRDEIVRIETLADERCEERVTRLESSLTTALDELRRVPAIVCEVARLIARLDPMRTPTPKELAELRTALERGGVSPSDISGLIAARGAAGQ